jgi:hypothetical protein
MLNYQMGKSRFGHPRLEYIWEYLRASLSEQRSFDKPRLGFLQMHGIRSVLEKVRLKVHAGR